MAYGTPQKQGPNGMIDDTSQEDQLEAPGIFEGEESPKIDGHRRRIRSAQTTMYVLAVMQFVRAGINYYNAQNDLGADPITQYASHGDAVAQMRVLLIDLLVCIFFAVMAFFTPRRPMATIGAGLAVYLLFFAFNLYWDPLAAITRILVQLVFVVPMVMGFVNAWQLDKMEKSS